MLKERPIEISIISLILLIVIILFGLKPIVRNLHTANLDAKVKKATLEKKQEKLDSLNSMKAQLNSLKDSLTLMQKALPKGEDVPGILVSTEAMVAQSGLGVSSLNPTAKTQATATTTETETTGVISETVTQQTGIASVNFSLSLSGGYPSFVTFLENLEKNIRPTSIVSIRLNAGQKDKPMTIDLNAASYYQK